MEDLSSSGLGAGAIITLCFAIIGWFIRQNILAKDEKIKEQSEKINDLDNEYSKLELTIQEFKGQLAMLNSDVSENRKQLILALSSIKDFISVNERIEKQLEKSNILHEDLKDLIKKLVEVKTR